MAEAQNKNQQNQEQDLNQILKVRREKLANLQEAGKDPFVITKYDQTHHSQEIKDNFDADGAITWFFSSYGGILELRRGFQASSCVGPGKSNLQFELRGRAGDCAQVTVGKKRPHLGLCPGSNVPLQGRQGSRGCIPDSPGESGLVSRGSK